MLSAHLHKFSLHEPREARALEADVEPLVLTELAPELKQLLPGDVVQRTEVLSDDLPDAFRLHLRVPVHEAVAEPGAPPTGSRDGGP